MKKMKHMKRIIAIVSGCLLLTSCNDFLSKNPDSRAELNTPENIAGLLVSAYPECSQVWFTEIMSDNATDVGPHAPVDDVNLRQLYHWERMESDIQDTPDGYWYACYAAIASANHALEAIEKLEKEGYYKRTESDPLKGEALLCRAYAHFMLVNLFAEHYDPSTAASTPGIPYVTQPETKPFVDYTRSSVAEVYDRIEADLLAGFPLIKDGAYDAPKWHFNRQAAATFLSRYYLYRGLPDDWDKVIEYAGMAIEDNPSGFLREWLISSQESFDVFGTAYSRSTNPANFLLVSNVSTACRAWYYRYSMDIELVRKRAVYGDPHPTTTSITNNFVFINKAGGNSEYGCYGIFKYTEVFKRDGVNANYGIPYIMNTPLVAEEAFFNQLEAEVMKKNYTKIINWLDSYYSKRVIDYDPVKHRVTDARIKQIYSGVSVSADIAPHFAATLDATQKTYLKCLVNIRASEFISEGQRWFDIKRMHLPVVHNVYNTSGSGHGEPLKLEPDDPRRVIPLPQDAGNVPLSPEGNLSPPPPAISVTPLLPIE
jgi:hypothetical protein